MREGSEMKSLLLALMLVMLIAPQHAAGESQRPISRTILETSPLGITNGGTSIIPINSRPDGVFSFLGARFTLQSKTLITGVGGHVKSYDPQVLPYPPGFNGDRSLFVAIVPTIDAVSFPDLALSQAVFVAVFDAPFNSVGPFPFQVPEAIIETHRLLFPGDYVIIFGSGLFGATGSGWMPIASMDFGTPRYIFANNHTGVAEFHEGGFQPARFVVVGFPVGIGNPRYTVTTFDVPGASGTALRGIDHHQVVGYYEDPNSEVHGFLYAHGVFVPLDVPDSSGTFPAGINHRGDIVGWYREKDQFVHGFLYRKGVFTTLDIDISGRYDTQLIGINNRGQIIGFYSGSDGLSHGFLYANGVFAPLAVPNARITIPRGINNRGQIVGSYQDQNLRSHGFIYDDGEFTTLDVPGASGTALNAINHRGQIAGLFFDQAQHGHGFVYANGIFISLDGPGASFTEAWGLDDAGTVVGEYVDSGGDRHGFFATPVIEEPQ